MAKQKRSRSRSKREGFKHAIHSQTAETFAGTLFSHVPFGFFSFAPAPPARPPRPSPPPLSLVSPSPSSSSETSPPSTRLSPPPPPPPSWCFVRAFSLKMSFCSRGAREGGGWGVLCQLLSVYVLLVFGKYTKHKLVLLRGKKDCIPLDIQIH